MESENKNAPGFTPKQAIWLANHGVNVQDMAMNIFAGPAHDYAEAKRAEKELPSLADEHLKAVDQQPVNADADLRHSQARKAAQFVTVEASKETQEAFVREAAKKPDRQVMIERFTRQPYELPKTHAERLKNIYENGSALERALLDEQFPHTLHLGNSLKERATEKSKEAPSVLEQQPDETPEGFRDRLFTMYQNQILTFDEFLKAYTGVVVEQLREKSKDPNWVLELGGRSIGEYERFLRAKNQHIKVIKGMLSLPFILAKQREERTESTGSVKEHIADWLAGVKIHEGNEPAKPTFKPGGRLSEIPKGEFVVFRGGKQFYFDELKRGFVNREGEEDYEQRMRENEKYMTFTDEAHAGPTPDQLRFLKGTWKTTPHSNAHNNPITKDQIKSMFPGEERDKKDQDHYAPKEKAFARQLLNSLVENFPHEYWTQGRIVEELEQLLLADWTDLKAKRQEEVVKTENDLDNLNEALSHYS